MHTWAAERRKKTNTPWVGRTWATEATHRASSRGGTQKGHCSEPGRAASETMANVTRSHGRNQ